MLFLSSDLKRLTRPVTFQQLRVLIGNGLLISHGSLWETHRRALTPAFHTHILHSFTPTLIEHADQSVLQLKATKGEPLEVSDLLFSCILDAIIDTSMGKKLNALAVSHCPYTHAFHQTSALLFKRMINPLLAFDGIFNCTRMSQDLNAALGVIHELMEQVIAERAKLLKELTASETTTEPKVYYDDWLNGFKNKRRLTLLDTLLSAQIEDRPLTTQEIRDEVNTFVFAGVDTTAAAMCFVLYALAKYPDEQRQLCDELASLSNTDFSITDLNNLDYLDMFIKEVLRYYTVVPLTGRQTTCDTLIGGRRYYAGTTLWIDMYGLAHDEQYFEAPHEFRPLRFSRAEQRKLPPYCYIPFSAGPHVCIGRKYAVLIMKVLTIRILQNFEMSLSRPDEELVLMAQMVLKSQNGIHLCFRERN